MSKKNKTIPELLPFRVSVGILVTPAKINKEQFALPSISRDQWMETESLKYYTNVVSNHIQKENNAEEECIANVNSDKNAFMYY